jgi:hypothetical protein
MADALGMMTAALAFLSAADLHELGISGQQEILAGLGTVTARTSAVHAAALAAFDAAGGPEAHGCKNTTAWLHHHGGMTKAAARGASKDSKTQAAHPPIADALAAGDISQSFASLVIRWTSKLPEDQQRESDCILITAAVHGCGEHELNVLGARLLEEYKKTQPDPDEKDPFTDRHLQLDETIDGVGKLRADLTPQATAALRAILDSLGKRTVAPKTPGRQASATCHPRVGLDRQAAPRRDMGSAITGRQTVYRSHAPPDELAA